MVKSVRAEKTLPYIFCCVFGAIIYVSGMLLSSINQFASGITLLLGAVILYLYIVFKLAEGNWMDVRAVFAGVWTGTVGLAALRLAEYQEVWQAGTWVSIILAFLMMQIGATLGIHFGPRFYSAAYQRLQLMKLGAIRIRVQEKRLFVICVITTLIGLLCFGINVAIKGYIPCFSDDVNAYRDFYTKFHVFSVASTAVSGLCFYCIKEQRLALWKKAVLLLCIFYLVFLFPVMVVSRGVFVTVALSLATTVFYLYRKNLIALIVCLTVIFGVYLFTSGLRNFTEGQMKVFFQPAQIEIPIQTPDSSPPVTAPPTEDPPTEPAKTFQLPPKVAFLYSYLTVSHDNLNEAVKHIQNYTWGIRQLAPFNVILKSDVIEKADKDAEYYQVNPYLNTTNLIGDFYYDFGVVGVAIFMLLWSFMFGLNQGTYEYSKDIFALLLLGNTMTPVAINFFASWMSVFTLWMMWGTVFLLLFAACITFRGKGAFSELPSTYRNNPGRSNLL